MENMSSNEKTKQNDSDSKHTNTENTDMTITHNRKIYFFIYCLLYGFQVITLVLPGTIFIELQNNLKTSTKTVSWIYSSMSIAVMISALLSGYIVDKFENTHYYLSFMIFLEAMSLIIIPFNTNIPLMFILFIFLGAGAAANDTCIPVYVFRLYPVKGRQFYFVVSTMYSISSMLLPLFVELSIKKTNNFFIPLFFLSAPFLIFCFIALFLPTPKHDKLRIIKRKISEQYSPTPSTENDELEGFELIHGTNKKDTKLDILSSKASTKLAQNKTYKNLQYMIIIILIISMALYASLQQGQTAFIAIYCTNYLNVKKSWGRYLISTYYASGAVYRVLIVLLDTMCPSIKILPEFAICIGFIIQFLTIFILWVLIGNDIIILYIVFGICGFFMSATYPGLSQWSESFVAVNGFIECLFIVAYAFGSAVTTPILGTLIVDYSAQILPFALLLPVTMASIIITINIVIYKKCYKKQETEAFET